MCVPKIISFSVVILLITVLFAGAVAVPAAAQATAPTVSTTSASAQYPPWPVNLYEFYRTDCPHCQALALNIDTLAAKYPTLHIYLYETQNDANFSLFERFESAYGMKLLDTVPTVFIGKQSFVSDTAEPQIEAAVAQAIQHGATGPGDRLTGQVVPTLTPTPIPSVNSFPIVDQQLLAPIPNSILATLAMLAGMAILIAVILARESR
jgi:thiol-disulfide isomerase/thioredoxin